MTTSKNIESRINELKSQMEIEQANNFPNGDLWNELNDKLDRLERTGDEFLPKAMFDEKGMPIGYIMPNGTQVFFTGMTFENSYH